ncbi:hypothetical protein GGI07_004970 [Coemansia sp. Benny D115]|nr:hypothetical protein GGI07_004970 [Coemansia sp. Benny D115]
MQSPTKTTSETKSEAPETFDPTHIPSDMLAAMAAIEDDMAAKPVPAPQAAPVQKPSLPLDYKGPFSQLTSAEHARYIFLAARARGQALGPREQAEHQRLRQRVEDEQQQFRRQLQALAQPSMREIPEHAAKSALQQLERLQKRALSAYASHYVPLRVAAIRAVTTGHVPLEYRCTLLQCGECWEAREATVGEQLDDPWASSGGLRRPLMSQDPHVPELVARAQADVALSADALEALLTLSRAHARDVLVPIEVSMAGDRRLVVVDRPLVAGRAMTARRLRQTYGEAAVRQQLKTDAPAISLGETLNGAETNGAEASYTLWEFGGTRLLVRCGIDGFRAGAEGARTTVTHAVKLEHFANDAATKAPEALWAANGGKLAEEPTETERLAWWLAAWLRGSPSEVQVTHVSGIEAVRTTHHTCADLFGADAPPSTHGLRDILAELLKLAPGSYLLEHVRGAWDATIMRAVERPASAAAVRPNGTVMDLAAELALPEAPVEDEVPVELPAWHGPAGLVPWTYPLAELAAAGASANGAGGGGGDAKGGKKARARKQRFRQKLKRQK